MNAHVSKTKSDLYILIVLLIGLLAAENLSAFSVFGFSLRRLSQALTLLVSLLLVVKNASALKLRFSNELLFKFTLITVAILLCYLFSLTAYQLYDAKSEHQAFIFARALHWTGLFLFFLLGFLVSRNLNNSDLQRAITSIATVLALIVFVYLVDYSLTRFNFNLLQRNAFGTDGMRIVTEFSYYNNTHRLLGGFKEPSHLGAFLLPLWALAFCAQRWAQLCLLTASIVLTLSILVVVGYLICLIVLSIISVVSGLRKELLRFLWANFLGLILAAGLVFQYGSKANFVDLAAYYEFRIEQNREVTKQCDLTTPLRRAVCALEALPHRGAAIAFLRHEPLEVVGRGLGSPYIDLKDRQDSQIIPSVFSGLISFYFAAGLLGLTLLGVFYAFVFFANIYYPAKRECDRLVKVSLVSSLVAIAFVFIFIIEEPTFLTAALLGLAASRYG